LQTADNTENIVEHN